MSKLEKKGSQSPVDMLEHTDTYGQAQVCSKGHQGSSVDRPCQPSFHWIKFWHVWNPRPQGIRLRLSVLVRYWAGQGEWSLSWKDGWHGGARGGGGLQPKDRGTTGRVLGCLTVGPLRIQSSFSSLMLPSPLTLPLLPSPLTLPFLIVSASLCSVPSLLVSAALLQSAYSQTETHMHGERVHHKIASSSGILSRPLHLQLLKVVGDGPLMRLMLKATSIKYWFLISTPGGKSRFIPNRFFFGLRERGNERKKDFFTVTCMPKSCP